MSLADSYSSTIRCNCWKHDVCWKAYG